MAKVRENTRRPAWALGKLLAVARKLLHAIYGMFRTLKPFDGALLFASPANTA